MGEGWESGGEEKTGDDEERGGKGGEELGRSLEG